MKASPYRVYHDASSTPIELSDEPELDVRPVLAIFWVASLIRVLYGLAAGQEFGVEATLAMFAVIAVPAMLFDAPASAPSGPTSK